MTPEQIKAAREKAGMTQKEVAQVICVHIRSFQKMERGDVNMAQGTEKLFEMFVVNKNKSSE